MNDIETRPLKSALAARYGYPDKRVSNIDKMNHFAVDDRGVGDYGADKQFLSPFCMIFAEVKGPAEIEVSLHRNVPIGANVEEWIKAEKASYNGAQWPMTRLSFAVTPGTQGKLTGLADAVRSIVARGAPRYTTANYKYTCPRVAGCLDRLKRNLDEIWS